MPTCVFPIANPFLDCEANLSYLNDVSAEIKYTDKGDHFIIDRKFETPAGPLDEKIIKPKQGTTTFGEHPDPQKIDSLIKDISDIEKIKYLFPSLDNCQFWEYHRAVEEMGEDGLVAMNIPGPIDYLAGEAYPMEQMMMDYYLNPELFDAVLKIFADYSTQKYKMALENGVRYFFMANFYISLSSGWSPEIMENKFMPIIKQQVDLIHSYGGLTDYYDDGKLMQSLELIVNTGVDVIETCAPPPCGDFDFIEAKKRWGDKVTFKGIADMINIVSMGTPEQIDAHVKTIIEQNQGSRGLILGTMDSIRPETPDENIVAYFNAANKYR
jgi:uroporphyrinogen decarboxylase